MAVKTHRWPWRVRRLSRHTEQTYVAWIGQFAGHVKTCAALTREERVRTFLEKLAPQEMQRLLEAMPAGTRLPGVKKTGAARD